MIRIIICVAIIGLLSECGSCWTTWNRPVCGPGSSPHSVCPVPIPEPSWNPDPSDPDRARAIYDAGSDTAKDAFNAKETL